MKIEKTFIEDLLIITPTVFNDNRGCFFESYNQKQWKKAGIKDSFVQDNQSCSKKGVIRGLHFQVPPFAQAKLVRVIKGSVMDVAVDIRKQSKTYGKHYAIMLSSKNNKQLFIPCGFAHGFLALEDDTILVYKCNNYYNKNSEVVLRYDDPILKIEWTTYNPIISEKDLEAYNFENFISPF